MTFDPWANFYKLNYPAMMNNHCLQPKIFLTPYRAMVQKLQVAPCIYHNNIWMSNLSNRHKSPMFFDVIWCEPTKFDEASTCVARVAKNHWLRPSPYQEFLQVQILEDVWTFYVERSNQKVVIMVKRVSKASENMILPNLVTKDKSNLYSKIVCLTNELNLSVSWKSSHINSYVISRMSSWL